MAGVEAGALLGAGVPDDVDVLATSLHRSLEVSLQRIATATTSHGMSWDAVRNEVLKSIDQSVDGLIRKALFAFRRAMSSEVAYQIHPSGADRPEESFSLDSSQLPFIRFHDEVFLAAQKVRKARADMQVRALDAVIELDGLNRPGEGEGMRERRVSLPIDLENAVQQFYAAFSFGSSNAAALPIRSELCDSADRLRLIADSHDKFGSELWMLEGAVLEGDARQQTRVRVAWRTYRSCGRAIRMLAAWMRCLAWEDTGRICDICYRHRATIRRCANHATKTHETRDARLGKVIRPDFLRRASRLSRQTSLRRSLNASLTPARTFPDVLLDAAVTNKLPHAVAERALILGEQLRHLHAVLSTPNQQRASHLFRVLVGTASRVQLLPPPRSWGESRQLDDLVIATREQLSLKGFFRAWFGVRRMATFGEDIPCFGFDRHHPVVDGVLDLSLLARHLLLQRAWEEELEQHTKRFMPTAEEIDPLLAQGLTYDEIARMFEVTHPTVRANRIRPPSHRRRNRLRRRDRFAG